MTGFRFACLLVQYLEHTAHTPRYPGTALLYNVATGAVEAWAADTREHAHDVGTPAVNLQRSYSGPAFGQCVILVSQAPTVMCIGMAAQTGVRGVVHCAGLARTGYLPGNSLAAAGAFTDLGPSPIYPHAIETWLAVCERHLGATGNCAPGLFDEFANIPPAGDWPAQLRALIAGRGTTPDLYTPGAPRPPDDLTVCGTCGELDAFWMTVVGRLVGLMHLGSNHVGTPARGDNTGCLLVSADNRILAWAVNTAANHPTFHAGTKCIWMFQRHHPGQPVPPDATLYTTVQPGLMCAGTIEHACGPNQVRVVLADADPTRLPPLAAARWDRVRRALHQRPDQALAGHGASRMQRERPLVRPHAHPLSASREPAEQAALRLQYAGGVPGRLLSPHIHNRLDQPLEIRRAATASSTMDETLTRTRERIRDLTTQMHAHALLQTALELRRAYIEH